MKKILVIILTISLLANAILVVLQIRTKKYDSKPRFHPFDFNFHVTEKSLINDGYKTLPEDVYLLGKKIGDTLIYYQLDYEYDESNCKWESEIFGEDTVLIQDQSEKKLISEEYKVYHRFCKIKLGDLDSSKIVNIVNSYGGLIISDWNMQKPHFFVLYWDNRITFNCYVGRDREMKYDLHINCDYPKFND